MNLTLTTWFTINKEHRQLYKEAKNLPEFMVLREIYDRYGQSVVDRIDVCEGATLQEFYITYMKQVFKMKNIPLAEDRELVLEQVIILETLLVENQSYTELAYNNIQKVCSVGEFCLEDILFVVGRDVTMLTYFMMNLTYSEMYTILETACGQLTPQIIDSLEERYIWSTLEI